MTDSSPVQKPHEIFDISPLIHAGIAVWPGDTRFSRKENLTIASGSNIDLSEITTSLHLGSHVDAPSHFGQGLPSIDNVDLAPYWGRCWVVTCVGLGVITGEECVRATQHVASFERILFRTNSFPDPNRFNTDFRSLSRDAVAYLGQKGTLLIGIDTPSFDPFDSKDLPAHHELARWNIRNLEGLCLGPIRDGAYEISALPLRIHGADASPVRAVLRSLS